MIFRLIKRQRQMEERSVFGFSCEQKLGDRVREIAFLLDVNIYDVGEYLFETGLNEMEALLKGKEKDEAVLRKLRARVMTRQSHTTS